MCILRIQICHALHMCHISFKVCVCAFLFKYLFFFDFCRKNCHYLTQHSGDLLQQLLGIENQ